MSFSKSEANLAPSVEVDTPSSPDQFYEGMTNNNNKEALPIENTSQSQGKQIPGPISNRLLKNRKALSRYVDTGDDLLEGLDGKKIDSGDS